MKTASQFQEIEIGERMSDRSDLYLKARFSAITKGGTGHETNEKYIWSEFF